MNNKLQIVVLGIMGRTPFAGVAWQVLHYLEGFRRLGHEVFYLEDTGDGDWPYDPEQNTITNNCSYTVRYISQLMEWCSLQDCWAYRSGIDWSIYGQSESWVTRVLEKADVLINLTGSTVLRNEHLQVPIRIYLETDPVLPQIEIALGHRFRFDLLSAHTHHFTFGENFGKPDCDVPVMAFKYHPTRQPIILDWWRFSTNRSLTEHDGSLNTYRFTTISNWQQSGKDIQWNGETYFWSKHLEFLKFIELPQKTDIQFELALATIDSEVIRLLESHGWRIIDAIALSRKILPYRDYIFSSHGEFTVAKDQNIRLRSGWFSDRSACYLSVGCPVITQDTGFGNIIPTGEGLFAFNNMDDILAAFDSINSDYERHSRASRAIAEEYFRAENVLAKLLDDLGI